MLGGMKRVRPPYFSLVYAVVGVAVWAVGLWAMPYALWLAGGFAAIAVVIGLGGVLLGFRSKSAKVLVWVGGLAMGFGIFDGLMPWVSLIHRPGLMYGFLAGQLVIIAAVGLNTLRHPAGNALAAQ